MRVFKFGGASVKDAEGVRNLASIVSKSEGNLVIVVSAMGKMTNALEELVKLYFRRDDKKWEQLESIKSYHDKIMDELFDTNDSVYTEVDSVYFRIEDRMERIPSMDFNYEYDQIIGYGELLSTKIVSAYLNKKGIKNNWLDIRFYLKTDDKWRDSSVNWEISTPLINEAFNFEKERIYLTQGFIGATMSDLTTTLGREGSDYTAAIIGSILKAEKVEIWKDVPGILNADPQYFKDPVKIDEMSYREAVELTFFGAKVIHPKTIKPLFNAKIPLHVKSFLDHRSKGTIIGPEQEKKYEKTVPVFVMKPKQVLITISQPDFSFMDEESMVWAFGIFQDLGAKINLIQQSALNLSVSIDQPEHGVLELIERLAEQFEVKYNDNLSLLTIRHYTDEAIEKETAGKIIYVEQKTRTIARYLIKAERK